jgi:hypothetical protein
MALPLDRFLNTVYMFMVDGAEQKDIDQFEVRLNTPPAGMAAVALPETSPWSAKNEASALGGLAAALGGGAG